MVEGAGEEVGVDGLDLRDAQRGLHGKGGDGGGAEEAVGREGLQIGSNAGAAGRVMTGDRENDLRLATVEGCEGLR